MERFLARQPIFDTNEAVIACELLYRTGPGEDTTPAPEGQDEVECIVSLLEAGLEQVTDGDPALVAISEHMLEERITKLLPVDGVILQVSAEISRSARCIDACDELAAAGYSIAVDGVGYSSGLDPLLDLAAYAKIDTRGASLKGLGVLAKIVHDRGCRPIATHVDSMSTWEECRDAGLELFQGRFFRDPELFAMRETPVTAINVLRLLKVVRDPSNSDTDLEEIFKADPSLTFKLLKIVNSAALGGKGIDSIGHGIRLLGRQALYRWLSVLLVSALPAEHDSDRELAMDALLRARFLESLAAGSDGHLHDGHLFLTGLFSLIHVLVGMSLEEAVEAAALPSAVREGVIDHEGPCGTALRLIEAYEGGDWPTVSEIRGQLPLGDSDLSSVYLDAATWSHGQMAA